MRGNVNAVEPLDRRSSVVHIREMAEHSVFVRVTPEVDASSTDLRTYLVEIEPNGYVPREVGLDSEGNPTFITRPGEYPISDFPAPHGSAEFEALFGLAYPISSAEFEEAYAAADAELD